MEDLSNLRLLEDLSLLKDRRSRVVYGDRISDLDHLDETDFKSRYRLNRSSVEHLLSLMGDRLSSCTQKNSAISPAEKLCIALRFFATGSYQKVIGDLNLVSQSSCYRAINDVAHCLAEMRPRYIYLPENESERREISQKFYDICYFPCIYGAIDCTHVPIVNPGGSEAELFRNRKGYFSLNVQTISDPDLYIRNIVARWPGSVHDSTIFDNSLLRAKFETGAIPPKYHLIGDNGYPCRTYLLTPFLNPRNQSEKRYNQSHIKTRNVVERQYGVWKRRFACLSQELRCKVSNSMTIIVATAVLHNIARSLGDFEDENILTDDDIPYDSIQADFTGGMAKRSALVAEFF